MPRPLSLLLALATLMGCAVYDHRWVQQHRANKERQRKAEAATQLTVAGPVHGPVHVGRLRIYASEAYRREHFDWQREIRDVIQAASEAWGPVSHVRLEIVEIRDWSPSCPVDSLEACLRELRQKDPASDVDWVVGLIGSVPRLSLRFDDLGLADLPGKHLVLRGFADALEQDAIEHEFPSMNAKERANLYRDRKRHKAQVALLHELSHTLGALHVREATAVMSPSYRPGMNDFMLASRGAIQAGVEDRFGEGHGGFAHSRAYYESTQYAGWDTAERRQLLERLAALDAGSRPAKGHAMGAAQSAHSAAAHPLLPPGPEDALVAGLDEDAASTYRKAAAALHADDPVQAWTLLEPLVEAYPNQYAVQHLACGLAMQLGLASRAQASCPRAQELSRR